MRSPIENPQTETLPPRSEATDEMTHVGFAPIPVAEKTGWVRRQFSGVAHRYDLMNTLLSFGIHYWWKHAAVTMMALAPGERVLDLCGGTGDLAVMAARRVGDAGTVILYDINREMMRVGRAKPSRKALRRKIRFVEGDAEAMALADASMDAVVVGFGMRNLTRMDRGFQEILRVLRPGGRMVCLEFSRPRAPVMRRLYDLYSFRLMPMLGEVITGSRDAYRYLPESIRLFPQPNDLAMLLRDIGFTQVGYRFLTNGIAAVHKASKPGRDG